MTQTFAGGVYVVSPADAIEGKNGLHSVPWPSARQRLRLLMPAETRSVELTSVIALLLAAPPFWNPLDYRMLGLTFWMLLTAAVHVLAILCEPPTARLRSACIFVEFCFWTLFSTEAHMLNAGVPGAAPGSLSMALAAAMAWSFLNRTLRPRD